MSGLEIGIWVSVIIVGLVGSALYSGLETGVYSLNRVRLHVLDYQNHRAARRLRRLIDNPTALLTTLLIGNNVTNYMGTAGLAVILQKHYGHEDWQVVAANALIVTPLLFVFGEVLPKDLFGAYSDRLMYPFARLLDWSRRLFTVIGVLPFIRLFAYLIMRALGQRRWPSFHPRRQVELLVREGVGQGLLSDEQSRIVERVLDLGSRRVSDEMVPWSEVTKVSDDSAAEALWNLAHGTSLSRFPVVDKSGKVLGVVSLYDVLGYDRAVCPPLAELIRPMPTLEATDPLRAGLSQLQKSDATMALVTDRSRPVGIVTVKDLVEPITGELASW